MRIFSAGTVLALLALPSSPAHARWATHDDADSEIVYDNAEYEVQGDGTYTVTIENGTRVLKEGARSRLATERLYYNTKISELEVLEAKTSTHGTDYPVATKNIEDRSLASSPQGFDQLNQVMVAFPQVELASTVHLKYRRKDKEAAIPGLFSAEFVYGNETYEQSGTVRISSVRPLFVQANDPDGHLEIRQQTDGAKHLVTIVLKKPVYKHAADEANAYLAPKVYPWVTVSTFDDWRRMAEPMLEKYEAVLNKPLPEKFEKIRAHAAARSATVDRINIVTSELAANVNYLGDWRSVSGRFIPRTLTQIADSKLGDCKDFSAATAAILRQLGMTAQVAWVKRGTQAQASPNNLPTLSAFNHAIVKVVDKEKTYWIDPTNFTSFAQGTYDDIAGRKALVLSAPPALESIPALAPGDAAIHVFKRLHFDEAEQLSVRGTIGLTGASAVHFTGLSLVASQSSIDYGLIRSLARENRLTAWKVQAPDLTSRVVRDLSFDFSYSEVNSELKTSAGPAYELIANWIQPLLLKTEDRVSGLFATVPKNLEVELELEDIRKIGAQSLDCSVRSPWVDASRQVRSTKRGVSVHDSIVLKKSVVPNEELLSPEFGATRKRLGECFDGVALIFRQKRFRVLAGSRK